MPGSRIASCLLLEPWQGPGCLLQCIARADLRCSPSHPPAPLPTHPPVRWPAATCRTFTTWSTCTWMPCSTPSAKPKELLARFCAPRQPACRLACIQAAMAGLGAWQGSSPSASGWCAPVESMPFQLAQSPLFLFTAPGAWRTRASLPRRAGTTSWTTRRCGAGGCIEGGMA